MGHIAHLRKQFKSINTRWLREEKKTLLILGEFIAGSSFEQTWIPFTQDALCQVWLKLAQWFWRRRFFNFVNVISRFRNYLPFEKGGALHLNKLESPSPMDAFCQVWLKFVQWFWRRRFFQYFNVCSIFRNYLPLRKSMALHLTKFAFSLTKHAWCQVCLKLAQWYLGKLFL